MQRKGLAVVTPLSFFQLVVAVHRERERDEGEGWRVDGDMRGERRRAEEGSFHVWYHVCVYEAGGMHRSG